MMMFAAMTAMYDVRRDAERHGDLMRRFKAECAMIIDAAMLAQREKEQQP